LQVEKCRKVGIRQALEKSAAGEMTFKQNLRIAMHEFLVGASRLAPTGICVWLQFCGKLKPSPYKANQ